MPFQNEKAGIAALTRILYSAKVKALQSRFKRAPASDIEESACPVVAKNQEAKTVPQIILAIDGGYHATPVESGYPGAEIGYLTAASVLFFIDKLKQSNEDGIVNPVKYREASETGSIDFALPGRGVLIDEEPSAKSSMRKTLFEEMSGYRIFEDFNETLLETYEYLMSIQDPSEDPPKCPCDPTHRYRADKGHYRCDTCHNILYSTDGMRCHELFSDTESCEKMYGHVMTTLERLLFIHILRAFEQFEQQGESWLKLIGNMAFVIDGPLAIYGPPAWLSQSILKELIRFNQKQKCITNRDMMILGIEKSGSFTRHFKMIDTDKNGNPGKFPIGHYQLIDNNYIRHRIHPSEGNRLYGRNTYFGRKMFYKTMSGNRLVVNCAC